METIKNIIRKSANSENLTEVEKAIVIAFRAGMAEMRGAITEQIKAQIEALPAHRFGAVQKSTVQHLVAVKELNHNCIWGRGGDSGAKEANELLEMGFNL